MPIHTLLSLSALLLPKGAVWTDVSGRGSATVAFATAAGRPRGTGRAAAAGHRFPRTEPRTSTATPPPPRRPRARRRHWPRSFARPRVRRTPIGRAAEGGGHSARGPFAPPSRAHYVIGPGRGVSGGAGPAACSASRTPGRSGLGWARARRKRTGTRWSSASPSPRCSAPLRSTRAFLESSEHGPAAARGSGSGGA